MSFPSGVVCPAQIPVVDAAIKEVFGDEGNRPYPTWKWAAKELSTFVLVNGLNVALAVGTLGMSVPAQLACKIGAEAIK